MKEVIYYESKKYKIINNTYKTKNYDSNIISKTKIKSSKKRCSKNKKCRKT